MQYVCSVCMHTVQRTYLLVSSLVSMNWLVSMPYSVPSACTLCQPVLIVSTSDKKYRFGVPFKVLTKWAELVLVCMYVLYVHRYVSVFVHTVCMSVQYTLNYVYYIETNVLFVVKC